MDFCHPCKVTLINQTVTKHISSYRVSSNKEYMNFRKIKSGLPFEWSDYRDGHKGRFFHIARVAVCVAIVAALFAPAIQLQMRNIKNYNSDTKKKYQGALGRWTVAAKNMWEGENIYHLKRPAKRVVTTRKCVTLHPNMPFTVILLSSFVYLPWWLATATFTFVKIIVVLCSFFMISSICSHKGKKIPDWVVALGIAWALVLIVSDIQHGNTNCLSLGAIVFHLWLYRKGRDMAAGLALALAICLKMTPALFILYWLYQRNWKLLTGCFAGGAMMVVAIPSVLLGYGYAMELTGTWFDNLVLKNAGGSWHPIHTNQSIVGTMSRYFIADEKAGNIFWDPESGLTGSHWITIVNLGPGITRGIIVGCQLAVVAAIAWAVGIRKLARDDGRRGLHYGMVVIGMMLLNQRTWDHHAAVILPACVAVWYAIAYGEISLRARRVLFGLLMSMGMLLWLSSGELLKKYAGMLGYEDEDFGADVLLAYGPRFWCFVIIFAVTVALCVLMRRQESPYADTRQTLSGNDR